MLSPLVSVDSKLKARPESKPTLEISAAGRIDSRRDGMTPTLSAALQGYSRLHPLFRAVLLLPALALPTGGCHLLSLWDPTHVRRGELIDADSLKDLTPGISTRADATSVLGSPTAHATFDDNIWIYITQITSTRIARTPGVTYQQVLVLRFDEKGTLVSLRQLDKADGKQIAMAPGATPSPGSEASFMQQLLGNVGRFTPAGLPGSGASGPSGGNTLP